jgi:hypothetical protein
LSRSCILPASVIAVCGHFTPDCETAEWFSVAGLACSLKPVEPEPFPGVLVIPAPVSASHAWVIMFCWRSGARNRPINSSQLA